ncbi:Rad4-domain-containing protein [Punctularia strigosozonata HHB-11173 SS5]|uniref:Rad4-domain-containing protein n=1 Tax=Punctularia strigosozonata (strain HHB-11173) TaxID=741275 RepID=UPI0004418002|nr:Rad4-domain-containing protein [Punctularia strigosozonata HHB-11173 SS5]EIN13025.1 Rad4-domain-containing protein [Punctularia strigosozonata HHB-11173 SS5]
MSSVADNSSIAGGESSDEGDWEPVDVAGAYDIQLDDEPEAGLSTARGHLEITIQSAQKKGKDDENRKRVMSQAERVMRINCHKIHTVALISNASIRNKWLNDPLLHARLMSLTPLALQNSFTMITKSRIPEAVKRGRLFESAVSRLVEWWVQFFEVIPEGHIRSRTFDEVRAESARLEREKRKKAKGKGKARAQSSDEDEEEAELIRSAKSLMKHALMREGSRDVSAQLFTALCRALGIPARLVVSLQSVPWQAGVGKPKPTTAKRKKKKTAATANEEYDDDMEEVDIPAKTWDEKQRDLAFPGDGGRLDGSSSSSAKGKGKAAPPVIKLRKSKPKGNRLDSTPPTHQEPESPDPLETPPVFWTEVFSKPDGRWIPVDPIRCIVNKRKAFDPTPASGPAAGPTSELFAAAGGADLYGTPATPTTARQGRTKVENRMMYVVAFEEDGHARDVTPRYARQFGAKVAKLRGGGKARELWWDSIMSVFTRPYRLQRDDVEDEELEINQMTEAMPTSMAGFKDHPLYVLERHLKRDEVIEPRTEIGKFRGEPVFPKSNVISLKTAENWMRSGRKVKEGAQPMKWVKQTAVTVNKRRAIEMALANAAENGQGQGNENVPKQGLYARSQTELYRPEPVIDGIIPKNDFGNIDLYVPSMLPEGAVHVPLKGTAKIARQLGFDYAEAVTGFEFRKRRANPVITGIVIAAENEEALLEAYWEAEKVAAEKAKAKKHDQILKRWTKLVQGLRIRQRMLEQYSTGDTEKAEKSLEITISTEQHEAGGFLTEADDVAQADLVVQPYHMPKYQYSETQPLASTSLGFGNASRRAPDILDVQDDAESLKPLDDTVNAEEPDEDEDMEDVFVTSDTIVQANGGPLTMEQLASTTAKRAVGGTTARSSRIASSAASSARSSPQLNGRKTRGSSARKRRKDSSSSSENVKPQPAGTSRAKRGKTAATTPAAQTPTRVLRSRKTKTAEQLKEEAEAEAAYRKATAE